MYIVCLQALMNVGYAHTIQDLQLILDYCTWLNGCAPLCPSKHFLLDTPMLVHDMSFILPTLSMDQEVIIFKTTFLYINAI